MKKANYFLCLFAGLFSTNSGAEEPKRDYNALILEAVERLPRGCGHKSAGSTTEIFAKTVWNEKGRIQQAPEKACPAYCSIATYQALLYVVGKLQDEGSLKLEDGVVDAMLIRMQDDGVETWGRWNANGPGGARLFYEIGLGTNTMDWDEARPGDFLKMFFNENIGKKEKGHFVVYLGSTRHDGEEFVRYWSSNPPEGRGIEERAKSKIWNAVFSRLEHPEALNKIVSLPKLDPYLGSLLTVESNRAEMREKIGLTPEDRGPSSKFGVKVKKQKARVQ